MREIRLPEALDLGEAYGRVRAMLDENNDPIPEGITFVSVERDSGRPASPDSTASFLEALAARLERRG